MPRSGALSGCLLGAMLLTWATLLPFGAVARAQGVVAVRGDTTPVPPRVVPGDTVLQGRRIGADTVRYTLMASRGMEAQTVGTIIDEITLDTMRNAAHTVRIQRVRTVQRGTSRLVDSTLTDARTLAPLRRHAWHPSRKLLIDFDGRRVRGSIGPLDVPSLPIDTTLKLLPFDSGNWDLLLRALPLAKGYTARFPVYDADNGMGEQRIAVTGSATVLGEEAHVVVFSLSPTRESVVWVGKTSGRVLQIDTWINESLLLRQQLTTGR